MPMFHVMDGLVQYVSVYWFDVIIYVSIIVMLVIIFCIDEHTLYKPVKVSVPEPVKKAIAPKPKKKSYYNPLKDRELYQRQREINKDLDISDYSDMTSDDYQALLNEYNQIDIIMEGQD